MMAWGSQEVALAILLQASCDWQVTDFIPPLQPKSTTQPDNHDTQADNHYRSSKQGKETWRC